MQTLPSMLLSPITLDNVARTVVTYTRLRIRPHINEDVVSQILGQSYRCVCLPLGLFVAPMSSYSRGPSDASVSQLRGESVSAAIWTRRIVQQSRDCDL
jgi:hypothetical protein